MLAMFAVAKIQFLVWQEAEAFQLTPLNKQSNIEQWADFASEQHVHYCPQIVEGVDGFPLSYCDLIAQLETGRSKK
jgi:hypothetical protein